jgi:hypothetical protein
MSIMGPGLHFFFSTSTWAYVLGMSVRRKINSLSIYSKVKTNNSINTIKLTIGQVGKLLMVNNKVV